MAPAFAIRLDIDTTTCARALTWLLRLADTLDVRYTIFVNMGRSVSLKGALVRRLRHRSDFALARDRKLSIVRKLGVRGVLETTFLNPPLFALARDALRAARAHGHEIGLHGGINHGLWHSYASTMADAELASLLKPALESFQEHFDGPFGFTSPGFVVHQHAYRLLSQSNCHYVSDHVNEAGTLAQTVTGGLPDVPVTLCGSGNVDFLEGYVARRSTEPLENVAVRLLSTARCGIYYTHPCFANGPGNLVFRRLIVAARQLAECVTMGTVATKPTPREIAAGTT